MSILNLDCLQQMYVEHCFMGYYAVDQLLLST